MVRFQLFVACFLHLSLWQHAVGSSAQELLAAAESGNLPKVKELISGNSVDIVMKFKESTPLHAAAAGGHIAVAEALLAAGVPISVKNYNNTSPIVEAVTANHADMVELLHKHGADIEAVVLKDLVYTPLIVLAATKGCTAVVEKLLDLGVSAEARTIAQSSLKEQVGGETPLIAASFEGHLDILKLLLLRGADRAAVNRQGNSVIHASTYASKPTELKFLLDYGGFDVNTKNFNGFTPVMLAAHAGCPKCIRVLMKAGASIDTDPRVDFNPLILSVRTFNKPLYKEVLSWKPNVNAYDSVNFTALYHALSNNHQDMARELLRRGAALGHQNEFVKGTIDEWTRFVETCDWFYGLLKSNGLSTKQVSGPEPHLAYCDLIKTLKAYKPIVKLVDQADLYGYDGLVSRLNFKSFTDSIDGNFEGVKKAKERAFADIKHLHRIDYRKKYEVDVEAENEQLPNILHRFSDKVEPPRPKDEKELSLSDILGAEETVRQVHRPPPDERPQHVREAETIQTPNNKKKLSLSALDNEL